MPRCLLAAVLVALVGCSEYTLVPDADPVAGDEGAGDDRRGTPWPSDDDGSPWDAIDPGSLPEEFFAIAWRPLEATADGWLAGDLRYDVVDASGEVAVSFAWPVPTSDLLHLGLHAAGPGRFLVVARMPDDGGPDADPYERRVWLADAVAETVTEVLRIGFDGRLVLPVTGEAIDLGFPTTTLRVAADPLWPDRLYVLPDELADDVGATAAPLYSFDWATADQIVRVHDPSEWLPAGLSSGDGLPAAFPWSLATTFDGARTRLVFGVEGVLGDDADEDADWTSRFYTWAPSTGAVDWDVDVTALAVRADATFASDPDGSGEGTALFQRGGQSIACAPPEFTLLRSNASLSVSGAPSIDCAWGGPLLDPAGPTFAYFGSSDDSDVPGHSLVVSHEADDVWAVDRFRAGVSWTPFLLRQVVRLEL